MTTARRWLALPGGAQRVPLASLLRLLPALVWIAGIFYLSQQARPLGRSAGAPVDSFAHFVEYAILFGLLWLATSGLGWFRSRPATALLAAAAASIVYAASDEWHQIFVEGRSGSVKDFSVDALGVIASAALVKSVAALRLMDAGLIPRTKSRASGNPALRAAACPGERRIERQTRS